MDIPAGLAANSAISRQNIALSGIKQAADRDQQFAEKIAETIQSSPAGGARGSHVNLLV